MKVLRRVAYGLRWAALVNESCELVPNAALIA